MRFVRYDPATGAVLQVGVEQDDAIAMRIARGETLLEVDATQVINPTRSRVRNGRVEPLPPSILEVKGMIASDLSRTDKYFTGDALENITPEVQAQWLNYRRALRTASSQASAQAMLAMVPSIDPYGNDVYAQLRERPTS